MQRESSSTRILQVLAGTMTTGALRARLIFSFIFLVRAHAPTARMPGRYSFMQCNRLVKVKEGKRWKEMDLLQVGSA